MRDVLGVVCSNSVGSRGSVVSILDLEIGEEQERLKSNGL